MKRFACIVLLSGIFTFPVSAMTFEASPRKVQAYVVKQLSHVLPHYEIALAYGRNDELFRDNDSVLSRGQAHYLDLEDLRLLRMLRGTTSISYNELFYLYCPFSPFDKSRRTLLENRVVRSPPYCPFIRSDDAVRFIFIKRQTEPLPERLWGNNERWPELKAFEKDAKDFAGMKISAEAFMSKYGIAEIFSNQVYTIAEGCVFRVDYPVPEMETTFIMRLNGHPVSKSTIAEIQKLSGLITLSAREVSEIVFIAYLQDGEDGIARYAEIAKADPLLVPMTKPEFQTELGKRLYAAVTAPPGVETEPEEAHHHHHPEMSEAERLAWVPPPNTNSNGNVWAYLNPEKEVQTIEFFTDGEVRTGKDGKNTAMFQWFKKDGVVEANSARWLESPDGQSIFEENNGFPDMRFLQRVWHRGRQPPPPDPKLAEALTEEGMRWVSEKGETFYVFNADGTCRENRRPYTPRATWEPWYGRTICIRHIGRSVDPVLAYISPDGTILSREGGDVYRKRPAEEDEKE